MDQARGTTPVFICDSNLLLQYIGRCTKYFPQRPDLEELEQALMNLAKLEKIHITIALCLSMTNSLFLGLQSQVGLTHPVLLNYLETISIVNAFLQAKGSNQVRARNTSRSQTKTHQTQYILNLKSLSVSL